MGSARHPPHRHNTSYPCPQAEAKSAAGESRIGKLCLEDEVTLSYWLKDTLGPERVASVKVGAVIEWQSEAEKVS